MSQSRLVEEDRREMSSYKQKFRKMLGHEEFNKPNIYKALLAEFLGTAALVLVGCGSLAPWESKYPQPSPVQISLAFGLIVATMVQCIGHISGGHINPAVSIGCVAAGHCSFLRFFLYLIVQCLGAILGSTVLWSVTPSFLNSQLGNTALGKDMTGIAATGIEFCITFVLVFTVLAVIDHKRKDLKGSGPLAIGLSITACHLFAVPFTGASMNTARTFGPAVVLRDFSNHYVYWVGPLMGGIVAGLLYKFVFEAPEEEEKKLPPSPLKDAEDSEKGPAEEEKDTHPQKRSPAKQPPPKV